MRCLRYGSLAALLALAACGRNPYRNLAAQKGISSSVLQLKPKISRELYRCVVDGRVLLKRFHLSGVLLFRQLEDGSTRAVFQNEMGIAFFDFKWNRQDSFSVVSIMERLDKPALIKTLRTDMNLLLMKGLAANDEAHLVAGKDTISRFPVNTGYGYYRRCNGRIAAIEYAGRSVVTTIDLNGAAVPAELPSSITFTHHKAHFSIVLRKLSQDDQ